MIGFTNAKVFNTIEYNKDYENNNSNVYKITIVDYDGSIIDAQNLIKGQQYTLPPNPYHEGLVFQEWSSSETIVDGKITIPDNNVMVGAIYTTTSDKNEIDIELTTTTGLVVTLNMNGTKDWGDGTSDTTTTHTYSQIGKYTIKCDGTTITPTSSTSGLFGQSSTNKNGYTLNVRLATITEIANYSFAYCYCLKTITLSNRVSNIKDYSFRDSVALKGLIIPYGITKILGYVFQNLRACSVIVIPKTVTEIRGNSFYANWSLKTIVFPDSITTFSNKNNFDGCYSLKEIIIPNSVTTIDSNYIFANTFTLEKVIMLTDSITTIPGYAFYQCYCLRSLKIPKTVTTIGANAFYYCYSLLEYDFSQHTSVPTLSNTNAFTRINSACKIKVPNSLLSQWKAATNWSTYADYIIGV